MIIYVDYASPSVLESTRDAAMVGLATNARRRVRFNGVVRQHGFILRIALRALGEAIWSNDMWIGQSDLLDPVITVLIIEHDMDIALEVARYVTVLHYGRVIADGTREAVRADPTVREIYLGA